MCQGSVCLFDRGPTFDATIARHQDTECKPMPAERSAIMDVSLPNDLADYVDAKVKDGRFTSSSAVVQEALRLMERVERRNAEKLADLHRVWQDGIESGEAEEMDFAALKAEGRAKLAASKA